MKTRDCFRMSLLLIPSALTALMCLGLSSAQADDTPHQTKPHVHSAAHASKPIILKAQGNPHHADFLARSSKRADLRHNIHRKGVDMAFTEWLRHEHPHDYRHYVNLAKHHEGKHPQ